MVNGRSGREGRRYDGGEAGSEGVRQGWVSGREGEVVMSQGVRE